MADPAVTRADVVAAARGHIGCPFHHQGRVPGVGLDCAGLIIVVGWQLAIFPADFDVRGYARTPDGASLKAYCDENLVAIEPQAMQPGDVLLVRWQDGDPQHLGFVADHVRGGLSLIHAESKRHNRVIETRIAFGRNMRLVQAYSLPGVV